MNYRIKVEEVYCNGKYSEIKNRPDSKKGKSREEILFEVALLERLEAIVEALQQIAKNQTVAKT